jgi:hypothetical protein
MGKSAASRPGQRPLAARLVIAKLKADRVAAGLTPNDQVEALVIL